MTPEQERKIAKVMREFENGTLRSSSGEVVSSRKQAEAIALSEAGVSQSYFRTAIRHSASTPPSSTVSLSTLIGDIKCQT